jgi:hypothetical protein
MVVVLLVTVSPGFGLTNTSVVKAVALEQPFPATENAYVTVTGLFELLINVSLIIDPEV